MARPRGFTLIETLVASTLLLAVVTGGIALLSALEASGRSLEVRDRIYREGARIADRLRADLRHAQATPFLETSPARLLDSGGPPEDDPATLGLVDGARGDEPGSPFNGLLDAVATMKHAGEGDSLYFRTCVEDGDRSVPANVFWRAVFRDENRNGRADRGERRLERIVVPIGPGPGGLDASRMRVQTITASLVHFRLSFFDARERRYTDPSGSIRRFGYPEDGVSAGSLTDEGVFTGDAVAVKDGFAELRRGDLVYLAPPGLQADLYPIVDASAGRLFFRLPGRPGPGPTPFCAAYLPIAIRVSFAIEGDSVERDQLLWSAPADWVGRADRRAIVRTFTITVALRGAV